jgi:hypothetical protein
VRTVDSWNKLQVEVKQVKNSYHSNMG